MALLSMVLYRQRPYSIRTRIKTSSFSREAGRGIVRDHIPLEQGLRPLRTSTGGRYVIVRDHIPLEQGLRLTLYISAVASFIVRDHIPLEQGLRHPAKEVL